MKAIGFLKNVEKWCLATLIANTLLLKRMMAIQFFVLMMVTNLTKAQLYMGTSAVMEHGIITTGQMEPSILRK